MKRVKVLLNMLLYGQAEPDIAMNPSVRRKLYWRGQTYMLFDKESGAKLGSYVVYK